MILSRERDIFDGERGGHAVLGPKHVYQLLPVPMLRFHMRREQLLPAGRGGGKMMQHGNMNVRLGRGWALWMGNAALVWTRNMTRYGVLIQGGWRYALLWVAVIHPESTVNVRALSLFEDQGPENDLRERCSVMVR